MSVKVAPLGGCAAAVRRSPTEAQITAVSTSHICINITSTVTERTQNARRHGAYSAQYVDFLYFFASRLIKFVFNASPATKLERTKN